MRKIISILLSLLMVISVFSGLTLSASALLKSGSLGDDVTWTFDSDTKTLNVTGTGATKNYDNMLNTPLYTFRDEIKKIIIGEGITEIGKYNFDGFSNLEAIEFPSTLTYIGFYSFGHCTSLKEVTLPDSVETLFTAAFAYCTSIERVHFGKGLKSISGSSFSTDSMIAFDVNPDNPYFSDIDGNLYNANGTRFVKYCAGKKESTFIFPDSVTSIADYAFSNCIADKSPLETVILPPSMKKINRAAFRAFSSLRNAILPEGLEEIESEAFEYCPRLTAIEIPSTVVSIGARAFDSCQMKSINIPASVSKISGEAFFGMKTLTSVTVDEKSPFFKATDGVLYSNDGKTLVLYPAGKTQGAFTVPDGVEIIGRYAFYQSDYLNTLVLPSTLTTISEYGIFSNNALTELIIPKSVTSIERYGVNLNRVLKTIIIENPYVNIFDNVSTLGYSANWVPLTVKSYEKCDGSSSQAANWVNKYAPQYPNLTYESLGTDSHKLLSPVSEENGTHSINCENCDYSTTQACTIAESAAVEATCTKPGHTAGEVCSECGYVKTGEVIPEKGHDYEIDENTVSVLTEATCTSEGKVQSTAICKKCGDSYTSIETVEKLPHTLVSQEAVEPTCTEDGLTEGIACSVCGFISSEQLKIKATGHTSDKGAVTKKATCTAAGTKTYKCTVCGDVLKTETIKATGHKEIVLEARTATAKKSGLTAGKKCSVCGKVTVAQKMTLAQVTGLKASTVAKTSIKLTWTKIAGAKYYKVERSTDGKTWKTVKTVDTNSYTVSKLTAGKKYQFRVTALDGAKKISGKASAVLKTGTLTSAPAVTLKSSKSKTAVATWKKVTGASKYTVYKSTDGKKWTKVTTTTKLTYTLTKLSGGKKIYVKVTAVNAYSNESAASTVKNVTVKK